MTKSVVGKKDRGVSFKNLFALGFVSFFTDMSSEMVFSLLPTFVIGLPGSSRAILGLIEGTAEALSYALRAVSGFFSDKLRKRKLFVLSGYVLSNVTKPLFAVARAPFDVFFIRVTDRVERLSARLLVMPSSANLFQISVEVPLSDCIELLTKQGQL